MSARIAIAPKDIDESLILIHAVSRRKTQAERNRARKSRSSLTGAGVYADSEYVRLRRYRDFVGTDFARGSGRVTGSRSAPTQTKLTRRDRRADFAWRNVRVTGSRSARPRRSSPEGPGEPTSSRSRLRRDRLRMAERSRDRVAQRATQTKLTRRVSEVWRRGWDSNPRAACATRRFRGAPVTTTSVPLRLDSRPRKDRVTARTLDYI